MTDQPKQYANHVIPNSFQTPNIYVDLLLELLSDSELRILLFATRHILGWREKIKQRKGIISLEMFVNGYGPYPGCGLNKQTVIKTCKSLVAYKILEKDGVTRDGTRWHLVENFDDIEIEQLETRLASKKSKDKKRTENMLKKLKAKRVKLLSHNTGDVLSHNTGDVLSHNTESNLLSNPSSNTKDLSPKSGDDEPLPKCGSYATRCLFWWDDNECSSTDTKDTNYAVSEQCTHCGHEFQYDGKRNATSNIFECPECHKCVDYTGIASGNDDGIAHFDANNELGAMAILIWNTTGVTHDNNMVCVRCGHIVDGMYHGNRDLLVLDRLCHICYTEITRSLSQIRAERGAEIDNSPMTSAEIGDGHRAQQEYEQDSTMQKNDNAPVADKDCYIYDACKTPCDVYEHGMANYNGKLFCNACIKRFDAEAKQDSSVTERCESQQLLQGAFVKIMGGAIGQITKVYKNDVKVLFPNGFYDKYKKSELTLHVPELPTPPPEAKKARKRKAKKEVHPLFQEMHDAIIEAFGHDKSKMLAKDFGRIGGVANDLLARGAKPFMIGRFHGWIDNKFDTFGYNTLDKWYVTWRTEMGDRVPDELPTKTEPIEKPGTTSTIGREITHEDCLRVTAELAEKMGMDEFADENFEDGK